MSAYSVTERIGQSCAWVGSSEEAAMAGYGVDCGSGSTLRDLVVAVESEPDVDLDEADRLIRQLRAELKDLDVESVTPVSLGDMPPGAKGVDPISLSALLISLSAAGGVFSGLIDTVRDWLGRQATARRISVTIDNDTIVLDKASAQERRALIDAYMHRHEVE